jgi:hypothetical protein
LIISSARASKGMLNMRIIKHVIILFIFNLL